MRTKYVLTLAVLWVVGTAMSYGSTIPACGTSTLSLLSSSAYDSSYSFSCESADKIYSNFSYVPSGADPTAGFVIVGFDKNTTIFQTGVQVNSGLPGVAWVSDFSLGYTVTVDQAACAAIYGVGDTCSITGAQGQFQGAFNSNPATMTIALTPEGTIHLDDLSPSDNTANLNLTPQPITSLHVSISGVAGATYPIDSFGLDLYQSVSSPRITPTPEPVTLAMVGSSLIGLALVRRRVLK